MYCHSDVTIMAVKSEQWNCHLCLRHRWTLTDKLQLCGYKGVSEVDGTIIAAYSRKSA